MIYQIIMKFQLHTYLGLAIKWVSPEANDALVSLTPEHHLLRGWQKFHKPDIASVLYLYKRPASDRASLHSKLRQADNSLQGQQYDMTPHRVSHPGVCSIIPLLILGLLGSSPELSYNTYTYNCTVYASSVFLYYVLL